MNARLDNSFPKSLRLLKPKEFQLVKAKGTRRIGKYVIIDILYADADTPPRLGLTVSRKYGKSHLRNRFKRLAREAFRLCQHEIPCGISLVVKPRNNVLPEKTFDLIEEFKDLL